MIVQDLQRRLDKIDGVRTSLLSRKKSLESEIATLKDNIELLTKVSAVLKHILDVMVKDEIAKMSGLVTYGLKTIFDDQKLNFVPVVTKKGEKLHIELITENDGIKTGFGSMGGSVAVIESFLLRVICMLKMKMSRLILLDETFASVGYWYIPATSKLINELSKKLGLDVLLVTHQKEFQAEANAIYQVKESSSGLVMEKLK
jgi:hypothetical protein